MTFGGHPGPGRRRAQEHRDHEAASGSSSTCARPRRDFRAALEPLLELPIVGDLRGGGFFYALELVKDKETRASFSDEECDELLRGFVSPRLFERGLICRADDRGDPVVQISPPLVAGQEEFDLIACTLGGVLEEAGERCRSAGVTRSVDAIVVGGGHNGLTCAAYLARAGLRRLRARAPRHPRRRLRDRGGLAGPARVARVVRGLDAAAEGRRATCGCATSATRPIPLDPAFATFAADGRPIFFFNDDARARARRSRPTRAATPPPTRASRSCSRDWPASCAR